jgi:hypothetical protein
MQAMLRTEDGDGNPLHGLVVILV